MLGHSLEPTSDFRKMLRWWLSEKLAGWSIFLDLFHGNTHEIAMAVQRADNEITPGLHQTYREYSGQSHQGTMDVICRIMFDMQQQYFLYMQTLTRSGAATAPTFTALIDLVNTFRATNLCTLPFPLVSHHGSPLRYQTFA